MTTAFGELTTHQFTLPEELILMLLNQESGYFHQVPGWEFNCAVIGAILAELSFTYHIDTDAEALIVIDDSEMGDPIIDPVLKEIAEEPTQRNAQYWIERLAPLADDIVDQTLDRLTEMSILEHHDGDFWTVSHAAARSGFATVNDDSSSDEFVATRIRNVIFNNEIPFPRDVLIICLLDVCDVLRFIFQVDDEVDQRIKAICKLDLIARSITEAVEQNIAVAMSQRSSLTKKIPVVPLRKMLLNPHLRKGNLPAVVADLAKEYGPVFQLRPPFSEPLVFVAGTDVNDWVQRRGRMYLRSRDYFADFESVYGAAGVLPSLDGADHFRLRKSLSTAFSRNRLEGQLSQLYDLIKKHMVEWEVGDAYPATRMSRRMVNAQISPLFVGVDTQDIIDDLLAYKERALSVHIAKVLPKFLLKTPGMRRRAKLVETLLDRVYSVHTAAQRAGQDRNLVDDYLSLHASDPQFMPQSNLRFAFTAALVASAYLGDAVSLTLYAMVSRPDIYAKIQAEADVLFEDGDPKPEDLTPAAIDVTHRFLMECLRLYPIVPMSIRNVMNSCVVEGYGLSLGTRVHIAQTATHFMEDVFPDPFTFDIDRYKAPRNEHRSNGYAPYGLGTHKCLGSRWMELQLAINVLMVAHFFQLEISPANYKFKFDPMPSMKPSKKLKFHIAEQRFEIPA